MPTSTSRARSTERGRHTASIEFPGADYERLRDASVEDDRSINYLVRKAVSEFLERRELQRDVAEHAASAGAGP